jgi:hypothetical protein
MRIKLPLLPLLLLVTAVSCKKSNSSTAGTGNTLNGSWNLIEIVAHTRSAVDQVYGGDDYEDVTVSDYTTTKNGGTITFASAVAATTGITYEASSIALDSSYLDGQLVGIVNAPFDVTIPATSGSSKYQQIGSDSLYFSAGSVFSMGTSGGTQTTPTGSTFTIHGDTLAITTRIHQVASQNIGGVPASQTDDALEIAYLKKQ